MSIYQYPLPLQISSNVDELNTCACGPGAGKSCREKLLTLLSHDLDFHDQNDSHASHSFHSFPAKFPPQLPDKFIAELSNPGDAVLDPMMGSGTTILEAFLSQRYGIGFDIDPLALLVAKVKVTPLNVDQITKMGHTILAQATLTATEGRDELEAELENRWNPKTRQFVNYWFAPETQIELLALVREIEKISDLSLRAFFELTFSAIIITKSGGVSLALDLAHTRPHKAKIVISQTGELLFGQALIDDPWPRLKILTKTLRSPLQEFEKRLQKNLKGVPETQLGQKPPYIEYGNAQNLPLDDSSVDLIITSPPYASNAIDYMRAHKFSLVWLGYDIDDLGKKRGHYIGGESLATVDFETMPQNTAKVIADITNLDKKKGGVLHRYYSEMTRTLREMFRVLKPGKAAIVVVGSSVMRGRDTETATCLAEIGQAIGFDVPKIGVRSLDRNRRMLPAGSKINLASQIQQRMHEEYVIGFLKPY